MTVGHDNNDQKRHTVSFRIYKGRDIQVRLSCPDSYLLFRNHCKKLVVELALTINVLSSPCATTLQTSAEVNWYPYRTVSGIY